MYYIIYPNELRHHGIKGQRWGVKNGPPYPLGGQDYSPAERQALRKESRSTKYSEYSKRHYDKKLEKGSILTTLSYNPERTKDTDMFFAAVNPIDKVGYRMLFNKKVPQTLYDKNGDEIGTGMFAKFKIDNKIAREANVASEDSAAHAFMELYRKDRDFYQFVTDPERMESHFAESRYMFRGYREAKAALDRVRNSSKPTAEDLQLVYRMYNYTIPSDGAGDQRRGKDVLQQRAKFFHELKKAGYDALLDTNDGLYGGAHARYPVIVFNQDAIIPDEIKRTRVASNKVSEAVYRGAVALAG